IQRTNAAGWVKYSYTRWGGAAMNTEAGTGSAAILPVFDRVLEALEALWPHLLEELADGLESFGPDGVEAPLADRPDGDQPRFLAYLEGLGDGLLGDVEVRGDLIDGVWLVAYQHQDGPAAGLRQRG